ncbi:MAG: endonuclease III [Leptolyngbyaceae cyanobacterium SM1_3_5]|nr:endonuclease III [Leptolyngbyaceae cyanobacterium SM1_3_5]
MFEIDRAIALVREAVQPYPKAAMFALAEAGYRSLFEQVVACILSIRTRDETSLIVARQLFDRARTPAEVAELSTAEIEAVIRDSTYADAKAKQILAIAQTALANYDGELPCDRSTLLALKGVGPKCAHLALGIACNQPYISVDIHVHRVTNRWGYVETRSPEQTLAALEEKLPSAYHVEINAVLVPFGKHICLGTKPRCPVCPLQDMCEQRGVN